MQQWRVKDRAGSAPALCTTSTNTEGQAHSLWKKTTFFWDVDGCCNGNVSVLTGDDYLDSLWRMVLMDTLVRIQDFHHWKLAVLVICSNAWNDVLYVYIFLVNNLTVTDVACCYTSRDCGGSPGDCGSVPAPANGEQWLLLTMKTMISWP